MIRFVVLFYLSLTMLAFAQLIGLDGINNDKIIQLGLDGINNRSNSNVTHGDCLLASSPTNCILYNSGSSHVILVQ